MPLRGRDKDHQEGADSTSARGASRAWVDEAASTLWVELVDGPTLGVPTAYFATVAEATAAARAAVVVEADGHALRWEELDEDVAVPHLLGLPYQASRWCGRRFTTVGRRGVGGAMRVRGSGGGETTGGAAGAWLGEPGAGVEEAAGVVAPSGGGEGEEDERADHQDQLHGVTVLSSRVASRRGWAATLPDG